MSGSNAKPSHELISDFVRNREAAQASILKGEEQVKECEKKIAELFQKKENALGEIANHQKTEEKLSNEITELEKLHLTAQKKINAIHEILANKELAIESKTKNSTLSPRARQHLLRDIDSIGNDLVAEQKQMVQIKNLLNQANARKTETSTQITNTRMQIVGFEKDIERKQYFYSELVKAIKDGKEALAKTATTPTKIVASMVNNLTSSVIQPVAPASLPRTYLPSVVSQAIDWVYASPLGSIGSYLSSAYQYALSGANAAPQQQNPNQQPATPQFPEKSFKLSN